MATANSDTEESRNAHVFEAGLGDLGKLPLELRREVWKYLIPDIYDENGLCGSYPTFGPCCLGEFTPCISPTHCAGLNILRTSRYIHDEVAQAIYWNRTLTLCINDEVHWGKDAGWGPQQTSFWTTVNGVCKERDLSSTDFSRFRSLRLNIRFPTDDYDTGLYYWALDHELSQLMALITEWQNRRWVKKSHRLELDVALDICPSDGSKPFSRGGVEVSLMDIRMALRLVGLFKNVVKGSIEVGFALRFGQEWLLEVILHCIDRITPWPSFVENRSHREIKMDVMCDLAARMTRHADVGNHQGPLQESPPEIHLPQGIELSIYDKPGMENLAHMLRILMDWEVDPSVVTKVIFDLEKQVSGGEGSGI
ncbi:MAG: hypothetical protein Q9170_001141 [Blastenia crenularia]